MKTKWISSLAIGAGLITSGCGEDLQTDQDPNALTQAASVNLTLNGIERTEGQHYEGWIVYDNGQVISSGRFNVSSSGGIDQVNSDGAVIRNLSDSNVALFEYSGVNANPNLFVLTIEPNGDPDSGPSSVHYVGGAFEDGLVTATVDHGSSIGTDFADVDGSYILATPTNGPATHNQGIWYLENGNASLELPELATGWAYEGWVVDMSTGEALSTGIFFDPTGSDGDGAGPAAGPNPAPSFPGQDYINPARVLNDGQHVAVISVEPFPDFDPAPFTIKILAHEIANGAAVTTPFAMDVISNDDQISIVAEIVQ